MEYKDTLCLPKTEFPMRANLAQKEPEQLKQWEDLDLYAYIQKQREGCPPFVLHDGPPYANGKIHIGTALNKILKDIIVKYKTMRGFSAPYIPGWDTHGLPIEHQVTTKLGPKAHNLPKSKIRDLCKDFALQYLDIQREQFKRLGVRGKWDDPYVTLDPGYEAEVLETIRVLVEWGSLYRSKKVVHWCPSCETALAEAEIEYKDVQSDSIYVRFATEAEPNVHVIIWTTTPWTLPANMAIAVHPTERYARVKVGHEQWILASELVQSLMGSIGVSKFEVVHECLGKDLEGLKTRHPFFDRISPIILADYVTMDTGTGCVHTAPGHGVDDFQSGQKYGLDVLSPVNQKGVFTTEAGLYEGMFVFSANKKIIDDLAETGRLIHAQTIEHSYPHCWRCRKPIIFRATEQWFISMEEQRLKERVLEEIHRVRWIPKWGFNRIQGTVQERPDWCISRQRSWGIPIPAFYCQDCGEVVLSKETIEHLIPMVRTYGSNIWYQKETNELLPSGFSCPNCGGTRFHKEADILDVWVDSGSSFEAVLNKRDDLGFPADLYFEGSDQHRGWFQASIFLSMVRHGIAPYKEVVTHGFIRDGKGFKMSKSMGNVIDPEEIYEKYGAEILRLWVAGADYRNDINVSMEILLQQVETYKKIRNTLRFLIGNLYDFDSEHDAIPYEQMMDLDRWILSVLKRVTTRVTQDYESYEFYRAYQVLNQFIVNELSAVYLDVVKDRMYVEGPDSTQRRSAQTAFYWILRSLNLIFAPVLTFTSEEVYRHISRNNPTHLTVQAERWPELPSNWEDETLETDMNKLLGMKEQVNAELEKARKEGSIGHSLDACVRISFGQGETHSPSFWQERAHTLKELLITSTLMIDPSRSPSQDTLITVSPVEGKKCQRCWTFFPVAMDGSSEPVSDICPRCQEVIQKYYPSF